MIIMPKDGRIIKMAVYTVKKDKLKVVLPAVKEFVKTVNREEPGTLMYTAFQKKEAPHELVHIMMFKNKRSERLHSKSKHARKFVDVIYPNCSREPVFIDLTKLL